MGFFDDAWNATGGAILTPAYNAVSGAMDSPGDAQEADRKKLLAEQANRAGHFAGQGETGFRSFNTNMDAYRQGLQRLASGQDSLSREQLRQGLQQNLAAQQAMAASANPNNAAMAARSAANNMARSGYGMSGQAAMAGIQERNAANQLLGGALTNQGNMNLQAALQSRQNAMQGYGAQNTGTPEKSWLEKYGPMLVGAGQTVAKAAA